MNSLKPVMMIMRRRARGSSGYFGFLRLIIFHAYHGMASGLWDDLHVDCVQELVVTSEVYE
jgi:hypothetical protein